MLLKRIILLAVLTVLGSFNMNVALSQCPQTAPYTENFDGGTWDPGTGAIDACWTRNSSTGFYFQTNSGTTNSSNTGPTAGFGGTGNYVYTEASSGATGDLAELTSPQIDLTPLTDPFMTFYFHMHGDDITQLDVEISDDGGTTWTVEGSIIGEQQTDETDPWEIYPLNLTAYAGQTIQVRFSTNRGGGFNGDVSIDELTVEEAPTCPFPSDLLVTNTGPNSADLSWTENGSATNWNIEYGPTGFTQGTGTIVPANSNPFTVTGLTAGTSYDFYVQADCGGGDVSDWIGPVGGFTNCAALASAPYTESFDGPQWDTGTGDISPCWTRTPTSGYAFESNTGGTGSFNTGPSAGLGGAGNYVYTEASSGTTGSTAEIISPEIDLTPLTTPYMTFYYHMFGSEITQLDVEISDDGGTTWTVEGSIVGQQQTAETDAWEIYPVNLSAYAGQSILVRFSTSKGGGYEGDVSVDQLVIEEAPTCPFPSDLVVTNIGTNSIELSWTNGGTETMWNIEYGPTGFTQGSGTLFPVTNNPGTVTGLNPATSYDFYLQADCGGGDESDWIGPVSAFTNCLPETAPYTENFDGTEWNTTTGDISPCWSRNPSNGFYFQSNTGTTPSGSTGPSSGFGGAGNYVYSEASSGSTGDIARIISPEIDLTPLTDPFLTFYYHMYGNDITQLDIEVTNDGGATWTNEGTIVGEQQTANGDAWEVYPVSLTGYAGQTIQVRFSTARGGSLNGDVSIDQFVVEEAPSCPFPIDFQSNTIGSTDVELAWTSLGSETQWNIEFGLAGFTQGGGTFQPVTSNPATITGLNPATQYDFYVQADCGGGDESDWVGPLTITTACTPFTAPFNENFDGTDWDPVSGDISVCWTRNPTSDYAFETNSGNTPTNSTGPSSGFGGTGNYIFTESSSGSNGDVAQFTSPYIDLTPLTVPYLTFYYHMYGDDITQLSVQVSDDGGLTWNGIGSIAGQQQTSEIEPWEEFGIALGGYIGQTVQIRFVTSRAGINGDLAIDEFEILEAPSCPDPTGLTAINIAATTTELDWQPGFNETEWIIEYDTAGFTLGTGNTLVTTNNPETITGLTPDTQYDAYVRAICSPGDTSDYSAIEEFSTECLTYMAPFLEEFQAGVQPDCWDNLNNTNSTSANAFWEFSGSPGNGAGANGRPNGTFAWTDGSFPTPDSVMLITPNIDVSPLNDPYLEFDWFSNNTNNPGDNVPLIVEVYASGTWNYLDTLQGDSTNWRTESYDLAAYAGQVIKVRFMTNQTVTNGSAFYNDILLDNVKIDNCFAIPGQDGSLDFCRLDDTVNLNNNIIVQGQNNGRWEYPNTPSLIVDDTLFVVSNLPAVPHEVYYIVDAVCESDTTVATIDLFPASNAGQNGLLVACRNEPVDLNDGLDNSADTIGTWNDPYENPLGNGQVTSPDAPGDYNYQYIADNGVCPADTAIMMLRVDGNCNYLAVGMESMKEIAVYPNPASHEINITNPENEKALQVEILDINGRVVAVDDQALRNSTEGTVVIDHLETGIYTLRVFNEQGSKTFKIVKQ